MLSFLAPVDFEFPTDSDANAVYEVSLQVVDSGGLADIFTLEVRVTDIPEAWNGTFWDDDDSIFEVHIEWLAQNGITNGCNPPDNTMFCPNHPVTREVFAVYMSRLLDLPDTTVDYYDDDNDSPFEVHINRLAAADITRGCGPNSFCPKNVIDRGQLAALFRRAFGLQDNGGGDLFTDDDSSIFEGDIDRLATAGVTKGCNPPDNTRYCPTLPLDRGAVAAFFHRAWLLGLIPGSG